MFQYSYQYYNGSWEISALFLYISQFFLFYFFQVYSTLKEIMSWNFTEISMTSRGLDTRNFRLKALKQYTYVLTYTNLEKFFNVYFLFLFWFVFLLVYLYHHQLFLSLSELNNFQKKIVVVSTKDVQLISPQIPVFLPKSCSMWPCIIVP